MSLFRFLVAVIVILGGFGVSQALAGDNGVIKLTLPDAAANGMGGAFVGEADRPSAVFYNPAGIVQMNSPEMSAGLTTVSPQLDVKLPSGDTVQMRRDTFIFPHVYFTSPVKGNFYFGVGENSNYGAGYDWAPDSAASFTRYAMIHDEFDNEDIMIVGAYKINEHLSVAAGPIDDNSRIQRQQKLFQGADPDGDFEFKAHDNAWGWTLAGMFRLNDQNQFGLTYKSPIQHTYRGKVYLHDLGDSTPIFGPYGGWSDVFGGSSFVTRVTQKFRLPQSVDFGYSFRPTPKWTLNFDLEWTDWSGIKESVNSYPDVNPLQAAILATGNQPRDWHSVLSESAGAQYAVTDQLRVRLGYLHHQTPIGNDTFDTAFYDATFNSVTTGAGFDLTRNLTLDIAYVAAFYTTRKVNNTIGNAFGANLSGKYSQFINIGMATLTYKF